MNAVAAQPFFELLIAALPCPADQTPGSSLRRPPAFGEPRPVTASQPVPALKPVMLIGLFDESNSRAELLPVVTSWNAPE
jgi:hypothetical protein